MAVAAALAVSVCGAAPAAADTVAPHQEVGPSERAAATVQPALVHLTSTFVGWVQTRDGRFFNNGRPYELTATCTGFGVHPDGYVATAGHCVDTTSPEGIRRSFIRAVAEQLVASVPRLALEDVIEYGLANWTVEGDAADSPIDAEIRVTGIPGSPPDGMPARVVDVRPVTEGDVALLKVETTSLPTLEIATDTDLAVGTPVLSAGYPASVGELAGPDAEPSIKDGEVSGRQEVGGVPAYEISAALTPGMSGGPTVDRNGRALGVNSFGPSGESQAFNFIVPATGITELLSRNGVRNELGEHDLLYREALDAYYTGRYTDAIDAFDRLLQERPEHPEATELRADAVAAREQYGDASDAGLFPLVYWVIVGACVLVVVVVGLVFAARSRRRRRTPAVVVPAPRAPMRPPAGPAWQDRPGDPFPGAAPQSMAAAGTPDHPYAGPTPGPLPHGDDATRPITVDPSVPAVSKVEQPVPAGDEPTDR